MDNLSKKVIVSCFLAACLEMYDFVLFGFLVKVIHANYLSFLDENTATIIALAFFAVGFVVRPIGALIFGHIGDVFGRKKALVMSVSCMGIASLSMSLLPTYAAIGIVSCYLIVLIRIIQGLSVGGEFSGAIIYAIEHFNKKKAGLVGGIIICGCITGVLLAMIMSKIVQNTNLPEYSWRFAFLVGFGLSIIGYFVRTKLLETPEFLSSIKDKAKIPIIEGIKNHPKECLGTIAIAAANGINFYFILFFLPSYINKILDISVNYFPILTMIIAIFLSPILSSFSDKIGREKMLTYGLLGTSIWGYVGLQLVVIYPSVEMAILFFFVHAIIYSAQAGTANVFVVEIFPVKYRYSCAAFCYSIGMGVIGGTSPMIASMIVTKYEAAATNILCYYMALVPLLGYAGMRLALSQYNKIQKTQEEQGIEAI